MSLNRIPQFGSELGALYQFHLVYIPRAVGEDLSSPYPHDELGFGKLRHQGIASINGSFSIESESPLMFEVDE